MAVYSLATPAFWAETSTVSFLTTIEAAILFYTYFTFCRRYLPKLVLTSSIASISDPLDVNEALGVRTIILDIWFLVSTRLCAVPILSASVIASLSFPYSDLHSSFQMYGFSALV